jgi:hypothetical protein
LRHDKINQAARPNKVRITNPIADKVPSIFSMEAMFDFALALGDAVDEEDAEPNVPPWTELGMLFELGAFFAAAAKAVSVSAPDVGGLMTPTMPKKQGLVSSFVTETI